MEYASLSSYSDEGTITTAEGGSEHVFPFHTKLARPNFYQIECKRDFEVGEKMAVYWCAGQGDFYDEGAGIKSVSKQAGQIPAGLSKRDLDIYLRRLNFHFAGDFGRIPRLFFDDYPLRDDTLTGPILNEKRMADEKIGDADCYVFADKECGTRTLWIGKQDFLIHQVRLVATAEDAKASVAQIAQNYPFFPSLERQMNTGPTNETETHLHIIINAQFTKADFVGQK